MEPEMTLWQPPPKCLNLPDNDLHLWRFELNTAGGIAAGFEDILSAVELSRVERLLDPNKKNQFISARIHLRVILGQYLQIRPNQVEFQYNQFGKPFLSENHHSPLFFNLSHSRELGGLVVASNMDVGVDLEYIDPEMNFSQLSHSYFNEQEKLCLDQYPHSRQRRGFFRLWTQKEAMLKLWGSGFSMSSGMGSQSDLQLRTFPIRANYICSIAFRERIERIIKFHFSDRRSDL
ncbi:MAG: 4'-phosphopantetheinyl transferase superfamily protein [Desulfuromusa sp.]|jgi:4'-phosphopantetheinyl transferase|nr:4'-phosphopantetheinyl transferase superfamily protein [Desulfuromusa sp.]